MAAVIAASSHAQASKAMDFVERLFGQVLEAKEHGAAANRCLNPQRLLAGLDIRARAD